MKGQSIETISDQIIEWCRLEQNEFDKILYGDIRFIIENGIVKRRESNNKKNRDDLKGIK